jgi:hypothetical protein
MGQMMMDWMLQSVLNSIDWQMIVALAGGVVLAHKAVKNVNKAMLTVACLALAGWWFWPQNKAERPEWPGAGGGGPVPPRPPYHGHGAVTPKPRLEARTEMPITSREKHDEALRTLAAEGEAMVRNDPAYLDPKKREERIKAALAKEAERKRKAEALAAKEKAEEARRLASVKPAPVPSLMTPDMACEMELRMHQRQRARAMADLQTVQQRYRKAPEQSTLIGGLDYERPWR